MYVCNQIFITKHCKLKTSLNQIFSRAPEFSYLNLKHTYKINK